MTKPKLCKRCNEPVIVNAHSYDVFEGMHWLCFHLEFEHQCDPDKACSDPSCPWWQLDVFKEKLRELGYDPMGIIEKAIEKRWNLYTIEHNKRFHIRPGYACAF